MLVEQDLVALNSEFPSIEGILSLGMICSGEEELFELVRRVGDWVEARLETEQSLRAHLIHSQNFARITGIPEDSIFHWLENGTIRSQRMPSSDGSWDYYIDDRSLVEDLDIYLSKSHGSPI